MADTTTVAPQPTTTVADNSAFGGPNAAQASAANAMLVTSADSRAVYNNNVTKLGSAINSITPGAPGSATNGGADAQKNTSTGTTVQPAATAPAGLTSDQLNAAGIKDVTGWTQSLNGQGQTVFTPPAGSSASATGNSADTGTDTSSDGADSTAGLPPEVAKQYKQSLADIDSAHQQAQATLQAATATLQNDPAALAAAQSIADKYEVLIRNMQQKNRLLAGGYAANAARSGGLQFANDMTSDFMSEEMDKANGRVADLVSQEQSLILKSNQAYKTGDLKAFNEAMTALDKTNNDKISALSKLLTATNAQVKTQQAAIKLATDQQKATVSTDISKATNLGTSIAKNIADSGITDQGQIDSYISQMAEQYGITNPDILKSAVVKAQQGVAKDALAAKNTNSIIAKRNQPKVTAPKKAAGGGTDGALTYTAEDIAAATNYMNKGDGKDYNGRGTDGFVDPGAYIKTYNAWVKNGGTPAGFVKKFPVTNVNPASYSKLPAAIQPKAKTTSSPPPLKQTN